MDGRKLLAEVTKECVRASETAEAAAVIKMYAAKPSACIPPSVLVSAVRVLRNNAAARPTKNTLRKFRKYANQIMNTRDELLDITDDLAIDADTILEGLESLNMVDPNPTTSDCDDEPLVVSDKKAQLKMIDSLISKRTTTTTKKSPPRDTPMLPAVPDTTISYNTDDDEEGGGAQGGELVRQPSSH